MSAGGNGRNHQHGPRPTPAGPRELGRDPGWLEARRMATAELFETGVRQAEIARRLGVSHQTVSRWHTRWQAGGRPGLAAGTTGRRPRLQPEQLATIAAALGLPPAASGLSGRVWTARSAGLLIARVAGVDYHPSQVWRILRQLEKGPATGTAELPGRPPPPGLGPSARGSHR